MIGISGPGDQEARNVAYNGHKRRQAFQYQAITTPDGLMLHGRGQIEGLMHDWTLYIRSGLDETVACLMLSDGR